MSLKTRGNQINQTHTHTKTQLYSWQFKRSCIKSTSLSSSKVISQPAQPAQPAQATPDASASENSQHTEARTLRTLKRTWEFETFWDFWDRSSGFLMFFVPNEVTMGQAELANQMGAYYRRSMAEHGGALEPLCGFRCLPLWTGPSMRLVCLRSWLHWHVDQIWMMWSDHETSWTLFLETWNFMTHFAVILELQRPFSTMLVPLWVFWCDSMFSSLPVADTRPCRLAHHNRQYLLAVSPGWCWGV